MKNCYFFALPLLAFLFSKNNMSGQIPARPDAEVYLRVGGNLSGWNDSKGVLVGLEGHRRLAGRLGLVGSWVVGMNKFSLDENYWGNDLPKDMYFSSSKIGLTRVGKKGKTRLASGLNHLYLPRPYRGGGIPFIDCTVGMTEEEEKSLEENRNSGRNFIGINGTVERLFRFGSRLRGSVALEAQLFHNQPVTSYEARWVPWVGLTFGVGF